MTFDYDYLIVGSGFGGSVSALRLAEKGWRVGVIEQGRRIGQADIRRITASAGRHLTGCPLVNGRNCLKM